jgi:hypothetical protein
MRTLAIIIAAAAVLVAGCGGSSDAKPTGAVPAPSAPEYTEQKVMQRANIITKDNGITYNHKPSGCQLAAILIGSEMVAMYADAGDTVASNPDRTVGVKITDDPPCHQKLTAELADL